MRCALEAGPLAPLGRSGTALLTTFRGNGEGASTPVSIALNAGSAYFITSANSGKARRLARNDRVSLAPCTVSGTPLGPAIRGRAQLLEGAARRQARGLLRPTSALFWSFLLYRLRGNTMNLYQVTSPE